MPDRNAAPSGHTVRTRRPDGPGRQLVAGKLAVPSTSTLVARPRLTAMLDRGVQRRLTLVTGPAGAGKTALLASWVSNGGHPARACWLSLDEFDNDPTRFRTYLMAALRRATGSPEAPPTRRSDAQLVNDLASEVGTSAAPVVLVLDDVQCLRGGPATMALASLLRQPLPWLHLVLSTRSRPSLPLERLHLAGELAEIDADDLALTPAEAAELWAAYGGTAPGEQVAELSDRIEGLVAGVCLAAIAAAERAERGNAARVRTGEESLADFFRAEVLSHHPRPVREFLLRSSVVEEVSAELANALTGRRDAPQLLDRLRLEDQLAGPVGEDPTRFRYRRPFREFLHREARLTLPGELPGLNLRAARWYEDHREPLSALRHAAAAGDWGYAAALVVREVAPQLLGPGRDLLCELPSRLPPPEARRVPEIAATFALVAAARGDAPGSSRYGALVQPPLAGLPAERAWPLRASLQLGAVMLAWRRDDVPAIDAAGTELVALLDGAAPGLIPAAEPLRVIAQVAIATARLWSGKFDEAAVMLPAAVVEAQKHGLDLAAADALSSLAFMHALRGQLTGAAELADAAALLAPPRSAHRTLGHLALGTAAWLCGDLPQARRCLADAAGGELRPTGWLALAVLRGRVRISEGDRRGAREMLHDGRRGAGDWRPPLLLRDWLAVAQAELHLAESRPGAAVAALTEAMREPANPIACQARVLAARASLAGGAPARAASLLAAVHRSASAGSWAHAEARLTEALAADQLDHHGMVTIALSEALLAAAPELLEPFLAGGEPVVRLLRRHRDVVATCGAFADRLLTALRERVGDPARSAERRLPEPITQRENVVLRFLPTLLTMHDIAGELSVSPNTVKTHLRNIYRKLSVNTRRDAVNRARTLGLLHP